MVHGAGVNFLTIIWVAIGLILVIWAGTWFYRYIMTRRYKQYGGEIDAEQFETTMRKAQVIDLRENNDFDKGHIMGARDMPYTQLKEKMSGLRKDQPVYLYDTTGALSMRAASRLRKAGFNEIYWLKNGYDDWSGKTKAKKYHD